MSPIRHLLTTVLFLALSVAMTWPLAVNLDRAVSDPGDPFITIWVLDWDWWATFRTPLQLFHANTFHPARYSLALSENLYGIAVLLFPLRFAGVDPITAYNVAMIAGFAFSGFGAYLLGLHLTRSWIAGIAAGVFYGFVPFRFTHLSHIQHVWGGWLPLLLLALLAYAQRPTRKRAALFAAAFVMNGLTNIHYLFFGAFATAVTAVLLLPRAKWRDIGLATGAALLILAPFLYPYAAVSELYGMQRTSEEAARFSAMPSDWLPGQSEPERRLFPGFLAYVTIAAAFLCWRRDAPILALGWLWIAIGFLGSLGLNFVLHQFLFGSVPGFRAIRVPARWAVIAYIGVAVLVALVTAAMARRSRWLALVVPVAFAVGLWGGPVRWYLTDPKPAAVYRWLAGQRDTAIVELPMDLIASDYEYMLRATVHHRRMANGISGFAPPLRVSLSEMSNATPVSDRFLPALADAGIELIIVHPDILGVRWEATRDWLRAELRRGRLRFVQQFDTKLQGDWVFRVVSEGATVESPPPVLESFLDGAPTCGDGMMGLVDFPGANVRFDRGEAFFAGWVVSRHGIRHVDVLFDNGTSRHRARLYPDPRLDARCDGDPNVTRTRYVANFDRRPDDVRRITDVLVEVTDGRGMKTQFDNRWFTWD